jgi:hypothetical protein
MLILYRNDNLSNEKLQALNFVDGISKTIFNFKIKLAYRTAYLIQDPPDFDSTLFDRNVQQDNIKD